MLSNDQKALAACIRAVSALAVTEEQLKFNKVPTLAIVGETDPLKVGVDDLKKVIPNLKVEVIKGADHGGALASPKFVDGINAFLKAHSTVPAAREVTFRAKKCHFQECFYIRHRQSSESKTAGPRARRAVAHDFVTGFSLARHRQRFRKIRSPSPSPAWFKPRRVQRGWSRESRNRSGWGIRPKIRPVGSHTPAMPRAEPLGLAG